MLAIKLKVVGRKNQRTFRVIVQEARSKLGGKFVEDLGWYNPHTNQYKINKDRVAYWISNGAQPTETVGRILKKAQTSETETYETREGRKRKKAKATKDSSPDADASRGPSAEGGTPAGEIETSPQSDNTTRQAAEAPSEGTPAMEEASVEKSQEEIPEGEAQSKETPSDEAPAVSSETSKEENPKEEHEESQRESASSGNEHQAHIEKEEEKK